MRCGRVDIALGALVVGGPPRCRSDVLECSVECTASHTYVSVLTDDGALEVHAISLVEAVGDEHANRQVRVCLPLEVGEHEHGMPVSAVIVACPPRGDGGLHVAVLAETGGMVVLNLSPYLSSSLAPAELEYSALDARDRVSVFRELTHTHAQARPVCMAPVKLSETSSGLQDVSYLILAGCTDGSIVEIYGVDHGSFIKRRHVFSFAYHIQSIRPSPPADYYGATAAESTAAAAAAAATATAAVSIVAECRDKTGETVLLILSKASGEVKNEEEDEEEDDDGIWKECDPSFSYDDAAHLERVNVKSFFVQNSDRWRALELTIPSPVLTARGEDLLLHAPAPRHACTNRAATHHVAILLPVPLSTTACVQSYLGLARDNLRGVTLLSPDALCAGPTDVVMATLSPALSAIFIFSLASRGGCGTSTRTSTSTSTSTCTSTSKCSPVVQVDLLPLLVQGQAQETVVVQEAAFLQDGHLLLGTSQRCLLLCSSELVVLSRFALRGDIVVVSPALTVTSTSVYAHFTTPAGNTPDGGPPPNADVMPEYVLIRKSLTEKIPLSQNLATSADAPLLSALTQLCDSDCSSDSLSALDRLMQMWHEPSIASDKKHDDLAFLLLLQSLRSLLPWETSSEQDASDGISPPQSRRLTVQSILAWAVQNVPSSIPRLVDAFTFDLGDHSSAALLQEHTETLMFYL